MRKRLIQLFAKIIVRLDSGYVFPEQKLNYKKSIDSIMKQSQKGRESFYAILISKVTEDDKEVLRDYLANGPKKPENYYKRAHSPV